MLGRLSVALLLVASPASAADPAPVQTDAQGQEFTTKKVCRTVDVAGSFIPRTHCVLKKVPVKKPAPEGAEAAKPNGGGGDQEAKGQ